MRKLIAGIVALWAGMAQAEEVVVAALGDSLTQGYGLVQDEGFVPQLQAWLDAQGADVRLINAGVSGDTTAGGLARIGWTLEPEVDGLILTLGGNDLLRGLDPAETRANLEAILDAAAAAEVEVLLMGMESLGNYGPDYKMAFDGIFEGLAREYDVLHEGRFFDGLGAKEGNLASVRYLMQRDGVHPNKEGVARIVAVIGPQVLRLVDKINQ